MTWGEGQSAARRARRAIPGLLFSGTGALAVVLAASIWFQPAFSSAQVEVPLTVEHGIPLRIILPKRVPIKRNGQRIEGRLASPVYVYNREVLPAGTEVFGHLARVQAASHWRRAQEMMGGNFAPLHTVQVEFDSLALKDGRQIRISTSVERGAAPMIRLQTPAGDTGKGKDPVSGMVAYAKQQIKSREQTAMTAMRGPGKTHRLMDDAKAWAKSKLPYHPEAFQSGTVFTAELVQPLNFGIETLPAAEVSLVGSPPPADCVLHARLLTPLSSATAHAGMRVEAVVTQPLFSQNHQLVIPQGTRLEGTVVQVKRARKLHRNGNLRFTFQRLAPPASRPEVIQASVQAIDAPRAARLSLDPEGGVKPQVSKQKYIAPTLAILATVWTATPDEDARSSAAGAVPGQGGVAGQTLAGGWKLGLAGSVISLAARSRAVTAGLGAYGAAWSVYSHLLARGREVVFPVNTPVEIRLGNHPGRNSGMRAPLPPGSAPPVG